MPTLLAETADIEKAILEEKAAPPGLLEVRFYLTEPVPSDDLQAMYRHLYENGVDVRSVKQAKARGLYYVSVIYNKPQPSESIAFLPLAIIPLIAFVFVSALIGIGIFKVENIARSLGMLALIIIGGTIVLAAILRKPIERVAERI